MSEGTTTKKEPAPFGTLRAIERYGMPTVLLVVIIFWARPHMDDLIKDHREFLKATSTTMATQTQVLSNSEVRLDRIENNTMKSEEMIRDIHGRVLHAQGIASPPPEVVEK